MRGKSLLGRFTLVVVTIFLLADGAAAQKPKKKKDEPPAPQPMVQSAAMPTRGPESDIIDYTISEMLGAWQIGDPAMLRKYFSDNVIVVSGVFEPALVGWANYEPAYLRQRARMTEVRLERKNTYIVTRGSTAWATFNWEFSALVEGRAMLARGQWSLVMERTGDKWVVTLNHTSVTDQQTPAATPAAPPAPAQNPPAKPPQ
jgi:ketosteroid isomerase-like protein